jgi:hypothetical protein
MFLSSELRALPVAAMLIAVGMLAVSLGVALVLSAGWGLIVGGVLALAFGVDAARDVVPMQVTGGVADGVPVDELRLVAS